MMWYSLEVPHRGTSNEYQQHMFSWRNKKNIVWILLLSGVMIPYMNNKGPGQTPQDLGLYLYAISIAPYIAFFSNKSKNIFLISP